MTALATTVNQRRLALTGIPEQEQSRLPTFSGLTHNRRQDVTFAYPGFTRQKQSGMIATPVLVA